MDFEERWLFVSYTAKDGRMRHYETRRLVSNFKVLGQLVASEVRLSGQVTGSIFGKRSRSCLSLSVHDASRRRSYVILSESANRPEHIGGFPDSLAQFDFELLRKTLMSLVTS